MGKRIKYAIGRSQFNMYVAAPKFAFEPIEPGQINMTYPYLKQHQVIALGTKTECKRGVAILDREMRKTRRKVPLSTDLRLLTTRR